ncbi:MAG: FixH family protein [Actinomycetota bacterium]
MSAFRIGTGLCVAVAVLTACGSPGSVRSDAAALSGSTPISADADVAWAPSVPLLAQGQRSGDLMVWLASSPNPPAEGDIRLETFVIDREGEPVSDASVSYDIDMTNMSHGRYVVDADPIGDGCYDGRVHLLMPGPWRVIVTIEHPEREAVRLRFEFRVET